MKIEYEIDTINKTMNMKFSELQRDEFDSLLELISSISRKSGSD